MLIISIITFDATFQTAKLITTTTGFGALKEHIIYYLTNNTNICIEFITYFLLNSFLNMEGVNQQK